MGHCPRQEAAEPAKNLKDSSNWDTEIWGRKTGVKSISLLHSCHYSGKTPTTFPSSTVHTSSKIFLLKF